VIGCPDGLEPEFFGERTNVPQGVRRGDVAELRDQKSDVGWIWHARTNPLQLDQCFYVLIWTHAEFPGVRMIERR
jgi:hypothetical protein